MEVMVACSAMAAAKEQEQERENASPKSKWQKWKRGGIIGAASCFDWRNCWLLLGVGLHSR